MAAYLISIDVVRLPDIIIIIIIIIIILPSVAQWQFGTMVTSLVTLVYLVYVKPGWYWDG